MSICRYLSVLMFSNVAFPVFFHWVNNNQKTDHDKMLASCYPYRSTFLMRNYENVSSPLIKANALQLNSFHSICHVYIQYTHKMCIAILTLIYISF